MNNDNKGKNKYSNQIDIVLRIILHDYDNIYLCLILLVQIYRQKIFDIKQIRSNCQVKQPH